MPNGVAIDPRGAHFRTAVINGVAAPLLLEVVMLVANNKCVMGAHTNDPFTNFAGWLAAAVMFIAAIGIFVAF